MIKWGVAVSYADDEQRCPLFDLEGMSKTEADFLYLLMFTDTRYVDYAYKVGEVDASDIIGTLGVTLNAFNPINN